MSVPFATKAVASAYVSMTVKDGVNFLGGFLKGFVEDNHLTEIEKCEIDLENEGQHVLDAI